MYNAVLQTQYWEQHTVVLKELEAEHFFALNLKSSTSAISSPPPPVHRPTLQCTFSQAHLICAAMYMCVLQSGNSVSFGVFLDRLLLSRVTYSTTYYPRYCDRVHNVTKGRTSIRNREQPAQRELESFCAGKKVWTGTNRGAVLVCRTQN